MLDLIAQGLTNRQIAHSLGVKEETVKMHVRNIMDKLQVQDRTEAVTLAHRRGIIHLQ